MYTAPKGARSQTRRPAQNNATGLIVTWEYNGEIVSARTKCPVTPVLSRDTKS